ncbi:MAG: tetratricopeptide repeat protein [Gammaproteobacteria bacterium]|nr:tetratricopeptide repeat protein [Gammaproteobacteria bacterium]
MTTEPILDQATAQHRAGDLVQARRLYECALATTPDDPRALFGLGLLDLQQGRFDAARGRIERAIAAAPAEPRYRIGLGRTLAAAGEHRAAAQSYESALARSPLDPDARFGRAAALQADGAALAAIEAYRAVLEVAPTHADALNNLGVLLCDRREFREAEHVLRRALAAAPTHAAAAFNLARALQGQSRRDEAIAQYRQTLALRPDHVEALCNLGNLYRDAGATDAAYAAYTEALRARPESVIAWNNLGCLLRSAGRLQHAEHCLRRAIELAPANAAAHDNLGSVLKDAGAIDEAITAFRRAVELDPGSPAIHGNLLYALSFVATRPEPILEEARRWGRKFAPASPPREPPAATAHRDGRPLRVGYVSPDFREHCQSLFTLPLFANHDRGAVRVYGYSDVVRPDEITRRIAAHTDEWRDVRGLDDDALASQIEADAIDVLVDLTMHMAGGRPGLFVRRPAPVQLCWLAYPGTTGNGAIDYRVSDPWLDPPGAERQYVERTVRLPDAFWCYDPLATEPDVAPLPALRNGFVTFGCLNNPCKLTDATLETWVPVLRALPASRLVLLLPDGPRRAQRAAFLAARGVDPQRIDFVDYRPRGEYLRSYRRIDIGLDTFPYNGHTTTLDALWMGVPVVTRIGETSVGRGGWSQLAQLGLSRLAADGDAAFVATAVALAADWPALAALRAELRERLARSPLQDARRFARNLERVYRDVWTERATATPYR